jgi:hypothetical protein
MPAAHPDSISEELLARLPLSADVYPQKIDIARAAILLIQFDASAYRAASFLDDRILSPATQGAWLSIDRVAAAAQTVRQPRPLHFIFHTGHVGSTLVSRLLEETGVVLSLREPLSLRVLADSADGLGQPDSLLSAEQFEALQGVFRKLWSRGYEATHSVILKATSSTGRMAVSLLGKQAASRAIYMNLRCEPYLATLLAGQNSPVDLRGHGPGRMRRLQARVSVPLTPLHALSLGELATMSWLVESWSQLDAVRSHADRVLVVDFDGFLANVGASMARIVEHLAIPVGPGYISEVVRSPVLTRYSKAPEHTYTPDLREQVLHDSRGRNREEIRKGLDWLERLAKADAAVAGMLNSREMGRQTPSGSGSA